MAAEVCNFFSAWRFGLGYLKSKNLVLLKVFHDFLRKKKLVLLKVLKVFEGWLARPAAAEARRPVKNLVFLKVFNDFL